MLSDLMDSKSIHKLQDLGGLEGLAKGLGSNLREGLAGTDEPMRKDHYGENKVKRKQPPSYFEVFMDAMQDSTVRLLTPTCASS